MKLGNPPIMQAWIEFHFEQANPESGWNFQTVSEYLDQFQEEYPEREVLARHELTVEKVERNKKPHVTDERVRVEGIRGATANHNRYLQLSPGALACTFLRTDQGYDGFEALKKESLVKLKTYVDFFRPTRLLRFALNYVDLIRIPFKENRINLKDYFVFAPDLPEKEFGPSLSFQFHHVTQPEGTKDLLEVRLWSEPPDPEGPTGRFRMDWRFAATEKLGFSEEILSPRMDHVHERLLDCFRKSFTENGWATFEPVEEG